MKFKLVGSHLCPNTLYSIVKCREAGVQFSFVDLSASLGSLKEFLALHEHHPVYSERCAASAADDYAQNGSIGLPCFLFEDGTATLDLAEALEKGKKF